MYEKIKQAVLDNLKYSEKEKYLTCKTALQIAKELNIDPKHITEFCNQEKIKIRECMLNCF
ncbi:MAG: hypothetical protein V2B14_02570 [bacterium]